MLPISFGDTISLQKFGAVTGSWYLGRCIECVETQQIGK